MGLKIEDCVQRQKTAEIEFDTHYRQSMNICIITFKDTIINSKQDVIDAIENYTKQLADYDRESKLKCYSWLTKALCPVDWPEISIKSLKKKEQEFYHTLTEKRFELSDCGKMAVKDVKAEIRNFIEATYTCINDKIK